MSPPRCWSTALLLSVALLTTGARAASKSDYDNLLKVLFQNYSRDVRPVNDFDTTTVIYLALHLLAIIEVNENDQTLKTNTILETEWDDEYLSWTAADHQNISSILMRQAQLWLPDIVVGNTVSTQKELGYDNLKLRIQQSGTVLWSPSGIFETACDIDITYYPFDTQVCTIVFKTSMSVKSEVFVYIDKTNPIDVSSFSSNGLWDLLNTSAQNLGQDDDDSKTRISFKLQLQRRRSFYILNIILPVLFLSVTSSLTFALPSDAGEKMGLSITVLLAYAVYLTLVTDSMPDTSVQISVLTVYLVMLLAVTAASVVLSVLILRLHHRPNSSPVTGCLASFTLALRRVLCMGEFQPGAGEEERSGGQGVQDKERGGKSPANVKLADSLMLGQTQEGVVKRHTKNSVSPARLGGDEGSWMGSVPPLTRQEKRSSVSGPMAAETLDRFIFLLFTFISLGSTAICLIVLIIGATQQEKDTSLT